MEGHHSQQRHIHRLLSEYIATIQRDDFVPGLNATLRSCASIDSLNNNALPSIDNSGGYYEARPELREYTLDVELGRDMDYALILEDGTPVTDKRTIRAHLATVDAGCDGSIPKKELLIRAANQSLLADAIVALTKPDALPHRPQDDGAKLGLVLPDPVLCMTACTEKCSYIIDLRRGQVEAICVLAISVPVQDMRLVLARAIVAGKYRPQKAVRYVVDAVQAYHGPLSRTLYNASISLAKDGELISNNGGKEKDEDNQGGLQWTFDRERFDADMQILRGFTRTLSNGFGSKSDNKNFGGSMSWSGGDAAAFAGQPPYEAGAEISPTSPRGLWRDEQKQLPPVGAFDKLPLTDEKPEGADELIGIDVIVST